MSADGWFYTLCFVWVAHIALEVICYHLDLRLPEVLGDAARFVGRGVGRWFLERDR